MKKTVLLTLFILLHPFKSYGDVTDYFSFVLGDTYEEVITRIDITDPYDCKTKKNFPHKVYPRRSFLYDKEYPGKIHKSVKNSLMLELISIITNKSCDIERVESLGFCPSTGDLINYRVKIPISKSRYLKSNPVHDKNSEEFIGPIEGDKVLENINKGELVSYETFNEKTKILKSSFLWINNDKITVNHTFFKKPKINELYLSYSLCPEGNDIISNFRPKYQSIDKVISTSSWIISRYEQSRKFYNKCSVISPENKKIYENYWRKFKKLNEDNFNKIKNKSEQIIISLDQKNITKRYNDEIKSMSKMMTGVLDMLSMSNETEKKHSLYHCNEFFKMKPYNLKDSLEKQFSLNRVDVDFLLNMKIK